MQTTLEDALQRVTGEEIRVLGSGRTDAGAHALRQVVAFSTASRLAPATLQRAMNAVLPRDIAVTSVAEAAPTFHPRFDAASRTYRYLIWNRPVRCPFCEGRAAHVKPPLDEGAMHTALQAIVGRHDFTSFVPNALAGSRERTVWSAECRRDGWTVAVEIEAQGFMRQMIRAIVGTLIDVGRGAIVAEDFAAILAARDRRRGGRTAPAHGLYLLDVRYEPAGDRGTPRLDPALQVQGWESSLDEEKR